MTWTHAGASATVTVRHCQTRARRDSSWPLGCGKPPLSAAGRGACGDRGGRGLKPRLRCLGPPSPGGSLARLACSSSIDRATLACRPVRAQEPEPRPWTNAGACRARSETGDYNKRRHPALRGSHAQSEHALPASCAQAPGADETAQRAVLRQMASQRPSGAEGAIRRCDLSGGDANGRA